MIEMSDVLKRPSVSEAQVSFGNRLGLDLTGKSINVARAMIEDTIEMNFDGKNDLGTATTKQSALAAKFGIDLSSVSRRVADATIADIMLELNQKAIIEQQLEPGAEVVNKHDMLGRIQVISSIAEDGTVYFKGGNGARAWARSLIRQRDNG